MPIPKRGVTRKARGSNKVAPEYCLWDQSDPIGKMEAAYGHDRDTWPSEECGCKKCKPLSEGGK